MKQYAFSLRYISEFDGWFRAFRKTCAQDVRTIFISIYTGWKKQEDILELVERLKTELPKAVIIGCTTAGEIRSGILSEETTVLNFMFFEKTEVRVHPIDFTKSSPEREAAAVVEATIGTGAAGVGLLMSESDDRTHKFLPLLSAASPEIKVFGAIAGVTNASTQFVFTDELTLEHGGVAIIFIGHLRIHLNTCTGWSPLGPSFLITKMEGDNLLRELDGYQAYYIYQKYLGMSKEDISANSLLFPLCTVRDGSQLMRLPDFCTEDGALKLSGDFREGENVRLCYGDPGKILDASYAARTDIMTFEPEAITIFPCMSRKVFLREDAEKEMEPFHSIASNCAGFYVYGEIYRNSNGNVTLLNMSLLTVSFREGLQGQSTGRMMPLATRKKELTATMKLVKHLVNFVAVTSAESELATHQLEQLASIDRLTGLYNRGEIESILRKTLLRHRGADQVITAIMIDLDDFKKVNDKFGHSVGDDVLRWCARVFHESIRRSDAAGRWGGEEFLIILPGAPLEVASRIAERIRKKLEDGHILPDGQSVTASLGVAKFPDSGDHMAFYKHLDDALYNAKEGGKNQVYVMEEA